ncbi:MAG TPA: L,D-transpeptidase [Ktedonosporobacter sp.]|nr:L,D-transpeptidase [Ktedonosporobacter sp.]
MLHSPGEHNRSTRDDLWPSVPIINKKRTKKRLLLASTALLMILLLSACGSPSQTQQQTTQNKIALDKALTDAKNIGVPNATLQPILKQEAQLSQTYAPFAISTDQYYTNLAQRYQALKVQVLGLETQTTQHLDYQATLDLHTMAALLSQRQSEGFVEAKTFADQLTGYQKQMAQAQYPKHYLQIINGVEASTQSLRMMGTTYDQIKTLQQTIKQLQASHLDTTALEQQQQYDLDLFRQANKPEDFTLISTQINAQLQGASTLSAQAIPYVGAVKLKQFNDNINLMNQYGVDTTTFQKNFLSDQTKLQMARTYNDFLKFSAQIDADLNATQMPLLKGQANYLLKQFHQEVTDWGNSHQYHDDFNGQNYPLTYEYDLQGVGSDADSSVQGAQSADDYQAAITFIQNETTNLKAMEADYNDKTSWDQPHATDMQLMQYYKATTGQVIVVSFVEESLRLYQDGKLIHTFQITSGQFDKPSVPGFWHIFDRESPTTFKSSEPKGSAFWYPDTKINFAMAYHDGGYFFHDSWWRVNYGPGTNFPHYDVGGDESFSGNGSHGCINMPEDQAGWLYNNTGYNTAVIIY